MACNRVNDYWHMAAPSGFVDYIMNQTGLSDTDRAIAENYRKYYGDSQFFADKAGMPLKRFNEHSGNMHRRIMAVIIPLAIEGWKTRLKADNILPGK